MNDQQATRRLHGEAEDVCALVQDILPFYLDGDLSAQSRAFIERHLETCDRCASFLAGGRSVQEHLRRDASLRMDSTTRDTNVQNLVWRGRQRLIGWALLGVGLAALMFILGFNPWNRPTHVPYVELAPMPAVGVPAEDVLMPTPVVAPPPVAPTAPPAVVP